MVDTPCLACGEGAICCFAGGAWIALVTGSCLGPLERCPLRMVALAVTMGAPSMPTWRLGDHGKGGALGQHVDQRRLAHVGTPDKSILRPVWFGAEVNRRTTD